MSHTTSPRVTRDKLIDAVNRVESLGARLSATGRFNGRMRLIATEDLASCDLLGAAALHLGFSLYEPIDAGHVGEALGLPWVEFNAVCSGFLGDKILSLPPAWYDLGRDVAEYALPSPKRVELGHAGHFEFAAFCVFHRHTHVAGHCVSTIGDWRPLPFQPARPIGSGSELYESRVFELVKGGHHDGHDVEYHPWVDDDKAQSGHEKLCMKMQRGGGQ